MKLLGHTAIATTILTVCCAVQTVSAQITLVRIAQTNNGGYASAVAVHGQYVFLGAGNTGLWVYDVANPANPINVAHRNDGGDAFGLEVSGNFLYLANDYDGLRIYDITNPESPVDIGHATNIFSCHVTSMALVDHYAVQADAACGLRICDVSPATNPIVVRPSTPVSGGQFYGPFGIAVRDIMLMSRVFSTACGYTT
jgi:hypothetical protein